MNIRAIGLSLALSLCGGAAFAQSPVPPAPKTDKVVVSFADRTRTCFFLEFSASPWYAIPYIDVPAMAVVATAQIAGTPVTYTVDPDGGTCAGVPQLATVSSGTMH